MANQRRRRSGIRRRQEDSGIKKVLRFGAIPVIVLLLIVIIMVMDRGGEDDLGPGSGSGRQESGGAAGMDGNNAGGGVSGNGDGLGADSGSNTGHGDSSGAGMGGGFDGQGNGEAGGADGTADGSGGADDGSGTGHGDGSGTGMGGGFDGQGQGGDGENGNPAGAEGESGLGQADPSQYAFQQDAVLELTGLVQAYCEAKEECDPELLAWVFGIEGWSEEEKAAERSRMELVKASVKSYENISCYSIQGPDENSYVIFPYYEIRYRETETLMPAFSWGYARTDESGRYYMVSETSEEVNDYIRKAGQKPEVKAVMAQIQARQQEAIGADEVLQKIYGTAGESEVVIGGVMQ